MVKKIVAIGFMIMFGFSLFAMEKEENQPTNGSNYLVQIPREILAVIVQFIDYASYVRLALTHKEMKEILSEDIFRNRYEDNRALDFSPQIKSLFEGMLHASRYKGGQPSFLSEWRKKLPAIINVIENEITFLAYEDNYDEVFNFVKPMIESAVSEKDAKTTKYLVAAIRPNSQSEIAKALIAEWEENKSQIILEMLISWMRAGSEAHYRNQGPSNLLVNVAEWAIANGQEEVLRAVLHGYHNRSHELSSHYGSRDPIRFAMTHSIAREYPNRDKVFKILVDELPVEMLIYWLYKAVDYNIKNNIKIPEMIISDSTLEKLKKGHEILNKEYEKIATAFKEGDNSLYWSMDLKKDACERAKKLIKMLTKYNRFS